jgi:large subunit ribosomal protein L24
MLGRFRRPSRRAYAGTPSIRKGDQVQVIAGKDRGKRGRVTEERPREGRLLVEGVNMVKRARRANPTKREQGGLIEMAAPLDASNVMVVCPRCGRLTRIGHRIEADTKERVCRKCGEAIVVAEKE